MPSPDEPKPGSFTAIAEVCSASWMMQVHPPDALAYQLPFVLRAFGSVMLVAFIALLCVVAIPLLPFAFVALCIWAIMRSSRAATVIPG